MKNLNHIHEHELIYFIKCELCNQYIDCRDLEQVLTHTHKNYQQINFFSSRKVSETIEYLNGKVAINEN